MAKAATNGHTHFEKVIDDAYRWADELEKLTAQIREQSEIDPKDKRD